MPRFEVSVIVPHFDDLANLDRCLSALEQQTFPRREFEIVIADNNSPVDRAALERLLDGRATLTVVEERGAGPARNGGVAASSGEILAFTDSDCIASPDWLVEGIAALACFDIIGGRVDVSAHDEERPTPTEAFEKIFAFNNEHYVKQKGFTVTANLFCRRDKFIKVGPFRSDVSEDVEWCSRARAAGSSIGYAKAARVTHPARMTWEALTKKWRRMHREMFALACTVPGGRFKWICKAILLPLSAFVDAPKAIFSTGLPSLRYRTAAAGVLFGIRFWRAHDAARLAMSSANCAPHNQSSDRSVAFAKGPLRH